MTSKDFWRELEINQQKEEYRCRKLFEANGKNYSYSSSEIKVLKSLRLI